MLRANERLFALFGYWERNRIVDSGVRLFARQGKLEPLLVDLQAIDSDVCRRRNGQPNAVVLYNHDFQPDVASNDNLLALTS
jgi:hypothetical protein